MKNRGVSFEIRGFSVGCAFRDLELVHQAEDAVAYLIDGTYAVDLIVSAGFLVIVDERLGLVVIGIDAVLDDGDIGVIGAAFDGGAVGDALDDHLVGDHDADDGGNLLAVSVKDGVKCFSLGDSAGEAVQQEAVYSGDGLEFGLDHAFDDLVGNEGAGLDEALGLEAELGAGGDLLAEQGSGTDVVQVVFLNHGCGLGALAGSRRPEKNVVLHIFVFLFVQYIDVGEVASKLIIVKSIADDEGVGDLLSDIIELLVETKGDSDIMTVEVELNTLFSDDYQQLVQLEKNITRQLKDEILITPKVKLVRKGSLAVSDEKKAVRVRDLRKLF